MVRTSRIVTALGTAAIGLLSTQVHAQSVTLESFDGTISLRGELLDFDGEQYRIRSAIGEMIIDAFQVKCVGDACPAPELLQAEFTISGSSTLATSLMPALLEGFSFALDADVTMAPGDDGSTKLSLTDLEGKQLADVVLAKGGSSSGLRDLLNGDASLALTTRPARQAEIAALTSAGLGNISAPGQENIVALDGLLVVTSPGNPVRAITETDIARVFSGVVTNWSELGGPDAQINLYGRASDTGTGSVFSQLVMRPAQLSLTSNIRQLESDADVSDAVASDPFGIGFTSFSNERNAKSLAIRGVCGIQTPATSFTIKTEEYPLTRRLYMYRPAKPLPPLADRFVEYLGTEDAQNIIADTGFVDQAVSDVSINEQGLRFVSAVLPSDAEVTLPQLQSMMQELVTADRSSITFRFEQGSARLDSRAEGDVRRLADLMSRGEFDGKELLLIGFTDSVGRGDLNANLSIARAEQVRQALITAAPPGSLQGQLINAIGYGEMSPLGCNETLNGRRINRRVELWTRDIIQSSQ